MKDELNKPVNPELFEAYLLGQLSDEQVAALERVLRQDPAALGQLAEAMQVMSLVRQEFAGQEEYQAANDQEHLQEGFSTLLEDLAQYEAAAQTIAFPTDLYVGDQSLEDVNSLSSHDLVAVGGYLLRKAIFNKYAIRGLGVAAVILLSMSLLVLYFASGTEPIAQETASMPSTPAPQVVATLTSQRAMRNGLLAACRSAIRCIWVSGWP